MNTYLCIIYYSYDAKNAISVVQSILLRMASAMVVNFINVISAAAVLLAATV